MKTISLDEFPLKWRWTSKEYCQLTDTELDQIACIAPVDAMLLWNEAINFDSEDSDFSPCDRKFSDIVSTDTTDNVTVSAWLSRHVPKCTVFVSWQPEIAVVTNSKLFKERWSEFCYPSSDDVSVWPEDRSWVLHYWHEEIFWYGKRKV